MAEETIADLRARFAAAARGRAVSVLYEERDSLLAPDYQIAFDNDHNSFGVLLRRGGCFEGAYRCLERWIEATAEELDGIDGVPSGHLDYRREMSYWTAERLYDQFRADLDAAVSDRIAWLEQVRPGENVLGQIKLEFRVSALKTFVAQLAHTDCEVRRALLSADTIAFLRDVIGADLSPQCSANEAEGPAASAVEQNRDRRETE